MINLRRVAFPSREISHFDSQGFAHSRIAHGETWQVSLVTLDGVAGGHEAASRQLLVVLSGRVVCAAPEEHTEIGAGEAVELQDGEWHETRSLEPARLLIVEGHWE
jgi:mannose-6-phosphate isomerase-like protein (cupin superfamily)